MLPSAHSGRIGHGKTVLPDAVRDDNSHYIVPNGTQFEEQRMYMDDTELFANYNNSKIWTFVMDKGCIPAGPSINRPTPATG